MGDKQWPANRRASTTSRPVIIRNWNIAEAYRLTYAHIKRINKVPMCLLRGRIDKDVDERAEICFPGIRVRDC